MVLADANEIIKGIWVGNAKAAQDSKFIKENKIAAIVNATTHVPNKFIKGDYSAGILPVSYIRVPVRDPGPGRSIFQSDVSKMAEYLDCVIYFIYQHHKKGKNILVHCQAGIQRSAAIMAAYLMAHCYRLDRETKHRLSMDDALKFVVSKRPQAFYFGAYMNFKEAVDFHFKTPKKKNTKCPPVY